MFDGYSFFQGILEPGEAIVLYGRQPEQFYKSNKLNADFGLENLMVPETNILDFYNNLNSNEKREVSDKLRSAVYKLLRDIRARLAPNKHQKQFYEPFNSDLKKAFPRISLRASGAINMISLVLKGSQGLDLVENIVKIGKVLQSHYPKREINFDDYNLGVQMISTVIEQSIEGDDFKTKLAKYNGLGSGFINFAAKASLGVDTKKIKGLLDLLVPTKSIVKSYMKPSEISEEAKRSLSLFLLQKVTNQYY